VAPRSGPHDGLGFDGVLSWDSLPSYLDRRLREQPGLPFT
jgi:hypothetical protein